MPRDAVQSPRHAVSRNAVMDVAPSNAPGVDGAILLAIAFVLFEPVNPAEAGRSFRDRRRQRSTRSRRLGASASAFGREFFRADRCHAHRRRFSGVRFCLTLEVSATAASARALRRSRQALTEEVLLRSPTCALGNSRAGTRRRVGNQALTASPAISYWPRSPLRCRRFRPWSGAPKSMIVRQAMSERLSLSARQLDRGGDCSVSWPSIVSFAHPQASKRSSQPRSARVRCRHRSRL